MLALDGVFFCVIFYSFLLSPVNEFSPHKITDCKGAHNDIEKFLGTKTPYRAVYNNSTNAIAYKGCVPVRILGIIRHGTRTPAKSFLKKVNFLTSLKDIVFEPMNHTSRVSLCEEDMKKLKNWSWNNKNKGEKLLTTEGENEMILLAERFQKRFPSLLETYYNDETYLFRFTATQRTSESARYFAQGLFGSRNIHNISFPEPIYKDPILRFYKLCEKWRKEVKKNTSTYNELQKYKFSFNVITSLLRISSVLGLPFSLNYDDVHSMYMVCSYETAWTKDAISPWCSPFSKDDLKVYEYAEDLKYFWRDGYGFELNHKQACPVIKHIVSFLKGVGAYNVFYFTHSGTILKLLSHLELYKDSFPLKSDTPDYSKERRKWRVSYIDSFGANLFFVLFNCSGNSKLLLMHQERITRIPGCSDDLCPLSELEIKFRNSIEKCEFDDICGL